jgi:hypothetical protein
MADSKFRPIEEGFAERRKSRTRFSVRDEKQFLLSSWTSRNSVEAHRRVWSARVTDAYRALAIREADSLTRFWIGSHDEYQRLIK